MVPGTFWYDFLTGPALGGLGALCAALLIGATTLRVSRDRREDATQDRSAERERASREEWFRRLQWAHELTASDEASIRTAGFWVIEHLQDSALASTDDSKLLLRFARNPAVEVAAAASAATVDDNAYVMDDGEQDQTEEDQ